MSTPRARHIRWLAAWLQAVIAETWNAPLLLLRVPVVRSGLGLMLAAALVFWLGLHDPGVLFWCWLAGMMPLVGQWCIGRD